MLQITPDIAISEDELQFEFVRGSGPGGQNVNKVATSAQLRFDVLASPSLSAEVKRRLIRLAGKRVTEEGVLFIDARQYRSQTRNREAALGRLVDLIRLAAQRPKIRRPTKPTAAARRRRLETKRRRSAVKSHRRAGDREEP